MIVDLVTECEEDNIQGLTVFAYVVSVGDIDVWPGILGGSTPGNSLRTTGNIVLKANKKFARVKLITDTGEIKEMQLGPNGSKSMRGELDFKLPKTGPEVDEWVMNRMNGCFIAIVLEKQGHMRIMGSPDVPVVQTNADGTIGMNAESERVWALKWRHETGKPMLYYDGDIDVDDLT